MGASDSLKMSYDDMQAEIDKLIQYANEFEITTSSMTTSVTTLCDGWTSASTETYRDDYTALSDNFTKTLDVVRELITSTSGYISDMQEVDQSYSSSKVTVG